MLEAQSLHGLSGVRHGFFTREGGVSDGIYASLNTGLGSKDDKHRVVANRERVRDALTARDLVTPYQVHSATVVHVTQGWDWSAPGAVPKADALVTDRPGIAIAVNTADCTPVLFADSGAGVVGAAHAGWKGALGGVLEATLDRMEELGAHRSEIRIAVGPTISQASYEVGPEYRQRFVEADHAHAGYFCRAVRENRFMFDLPGFICDRLKGAGAGKVELVAPCTYAEEDRFFSYRRATHRKEPDYGRQMSAIVLGD